MGEYLPLIFISFVFLIYTLFTKKLEHSVISGPLFFTIIGLLTFYMFGMDNSLILESSFIHHFAEVTLVLVLFTDASNIEWKRLKKVWTLPIRLLFVAMPLSIFLGVVICYLLFPQITVFEIVIVVAILTPTDAALGHAVITNKNVPESIRQGLNVESGLNDGIALPVVLLFAALASSIAMEHEVNWTLFVFEQLTLAPIVGVMVGFGAASLINLAIKKHWIIHHFSGISSLLTAFLSFLISEAVGGNGFIAAFLSGLAYGNTLINPCPFLKDFPETEGNLFTLGVFVIFGLFMLPDVIDHFNWMWLVFAIASLTIIRMLPVLISLVGTNLPMSHKLFVGWFGPRGLASILFLLIILEEYQFQNLIFIKGTVLITVFLSIILHGMTANKFSNKLPT